MFKFQPTEGDHHDDRQHRHAQAQDHEQVVDWTDLGREMWSFLTGREAAINYRFIDMAVEVPRDTGADAPRATWKLNGTLQVTTQDNEHPYRASA